MNGTMKSAAVKVLGLLLVTKLARSFVTRSFPSYGCGCANTVNAKGLHMSRTLSSTDMQDILEGTTFLGSGGGGSKDVGQKVLEYTKQYLKETGTSIVLMDPVEGTADNLPGNAWVTTMAGIGSPSDAEKLESPFSHGMKKAFDYLSELLIAQENAKGVEISKIDYVCPGEIGPWSAMATLLTAAQTGRPVIDADGGGRAYPNLAMTAYAGANVSVNPMTLANDQPEFFPNGTVNTESVTAGFQVQTEDVVESCSRYLLSAPEFGGVAGFSTWAMDVTKLRSCMTANTLTLARDIGEAVRTAPGVDSVMKVLSNHVPYAEQLFTGTIMRMETVTKDTFDFDTIALFNSTTGQSALISAENENLIMYKYMDQGSTQAPVCIGPDSICYLLGNGTTITNVNLEEGMTVNVIGIQASPVLTRYPEVMAAFSSSLSKLGYYGNYISLQALSKANESKE